VKKNQLKSRLLIGGGFKPNFSVIPINIRTYPGALHEREGEYHSPLHMALTAVFMLVDHSRDVACKVSRRFWLWWCSSSIWKPL